MQPPPTLSRLPVGGRHSPAEGQIARDKRRPLLVGEIDEPVQEVTLRLELKAQRSPQSEIAAEGFSQFAHATPPGQGCAIERSAAKSTLA